MIKHWVELVLTISKENYFFEASHHFRKHLEWLMCAQRNNKKSEVLKCFSLKITLIIIIMQMLLIEGLHLHVRYKSQYEMKPSILENARKIQIIQGL